MAVIIGNGRLRVSRGLRERLRRADLVICADGGVKAAHALRIVPHLIVGDLDSAPPKVLRWAASRDVALQRHPREKDKTDAELALEAAVARGATDVSFVGVLGNRIDHTLANLWLLVRAAEAGVHARILHGREELLLVRGLTAIPGAALHHLVQGAAGTRVSLLPLSAQVTGVTLQGVKYPLRQATLVAGSTLGISNEITIPPVSVEVRSGLLLIVVGHRT